MDLSFSVVQKPESITNARSNSRYTAMVEKINKLTDTECVRVAVPQDKLTNISAFQSNLSQNLKRLGLQVKTQKHTDAAGTVILVSKGQPRQNKKKDSSV